MSFDGVLLAHLAISPRLLGSLIVLGISLIVWAIVAIVKAASKPPPGAMGQGGVVAPRFCSTCGTAARWLEPQKGWGCDRCQRMLPLAQPMHPQMQQPQPMPMQPVQHPQPMPVQPSQPILPIQQQAPAGPACPTCASPGRWIAESNAWGCDRCRVFIAAR